MFITSAFFSQVSQSAADKVEQQLQKEVFEKWSESFETMKCTKVKSGNIIRFLDHMEANYEGKLNHYFLHHLTLKKM